MRRSTEVAAAWRSVFMAAALTAALASACENRQQNRDCTDALLEGKAAVAKGATADARRALESARSSCPQSREFYVKRLSEQIETKEREETEKRAETARLAELRRKEPLQDFVAWIGKRRDDSDKRGPGVKCAERGTPRYGFCEEVVETKNRKRRLEFWAADHDAYSFDGRFPAPVTCDDLGKHRVVRKWTLASPPGTTAQHCELTGGPLKGLVALVRADDGSPDTVHIMVFSREYLKRSDKTRTLLDEGRQR